MNNKSWRTIAICLIIFSIIFITCFTLSSNAEEIIEIKLPVIMEVDVHKDSGLRVRRGAGLEYIGYGFLADEAKVLVLEIQNGWAYVAWPKYPDYPFGWVCMDYLK